MSLKTLMQKQSWVLLPIMEQTNGLVAAVVRALQCLTLLHGQISKKTTGKPSSLCSSLYLSRYFISFWWKLIIRIQDSLVDWILISCRVSQPACFGASPAPGIFYPEPAPGKREHNFGIF